MNRHFHWELIVQFLKLLILKYLHVKLDSYRERDRVGYSTALYKKVKSLSSPKILLLQAT